MAELVDWNKTLHLTIPKTASLTDLKTVLHETTGVPIAQQGIWSCCARSAPSQPAPEKGGQIGGKGGAQALRESARREEKSESKGGPGEG